ncbi:MAG: NADP oxidoreductase, partial [Chloroflexota bacterium]|nr:NADP oxidoreductase [Chloroflexota bacterium]
EIANDSEAQKNINHLRELAARGITGKPRRIHFRFLVSPVAIIGEDGQVAAVQIEKNVLQPDETGYLVAHGTGELTTISVGLVLRSVGYKGIALPDVPYDVRTGTIPNVQGRVINPNTGTPLAGEYVVGWAKRGPTGVIGTNKPDAAETVTHMLADLPTLPPAPEPDPAAVDAILAARELRFVTLEEWRILDEIEVTKGTAHGKPRVKFTRLQEILTTLADSVKSKTSE